MNRYLFCSAKFNFLFSACVFCIFCFSGNLWAVPEEKEPFVCSRKPSDSELEHARKLHTLAVEQNKSGDYDKAIENWKYVYKIDCSAHGVLLNLGNVYEKKGEIESAIAYLESYLSRVPGSSDAEAIRKKIENLYKKIEKGVPPAAPIHLQMKKPQTEELERPYGVYPWFVVGVGGVAMVSGGVLIWIGKSNINSAEESCGTESICSDPSKADDGNKGKSQINWGSIALATGGVTLGGGLLWQYLWNKPEKKNVALIPVVTHVYNGISVSGRF